MGRAPERREDHYLLDLFGVVSIVAATLAVVYVPLLSQTPLRILVGIPFVLFVPGYAIVAALFPEASGTETGDGLSGFERVSTSVGASVGILPFIGFGLDVSSFGINLTPVVTAISVLTIGVTGVAVWRRRQVPAENRFRVPFRRGASRVRRHLTRPTSKFDALLNVVVIVSLLAATGTAGYALLLPSQEAPFTEFYLLTEDDTGTLVADDYPQAFTAGESQELVVGVENHEHETVSYTVIVQLQRFDASDGAATIVEQERLQTFEARLSSNETQRWPHEVTPTIAGNRIRLTYLLFNESVPAEPSVENAYREVHLWINVSSDATNQVEQRSTPDIPVERTAVSSVHSGDASQSATRATISYDEQFQ